MRQIWTEMRLFLQFASCLLFGTKLTGAFRNFANKSTAQSIPLTKINLSSSPLEYGGSFFAS